MLEGMNALWEPLERKEDGTYWVDVCPGSTIDTAIREAISLAKQLGAEVRFEFNAVQVAVRGDSSETLIYRDWHRATNRYIEGPAGPYPAPVLSDEEKANDARIEAENEAKRQKREAEHQARAKAKREAVEAKMAGAPAFEVGDEAKWQAWRDSNSDPYGGAVISYAERWARLMQVEMAAGKALEDVADETSHQADLEGITGFMYGAAVSVLASCWKYGEDLRVWHNLKVQVKDEGARANLDGGVLNPALLTLG